VLQLPWISQARAIPLAHTFVRGEELPSVQELSIAEPFATPKQFLEPRISTNATLKDLSAAAERLPFSQHPSPQPSSVSTSTGSDSTSILEPPNNTAGSSMSPSSGSLNGSANGTGAQSRTKDGPSGLQHALMMYDAEDYILLPCDKDGVLQHASRSVVPFLLSYVCKTAAKVS
jgi:hypothetical protein